MRLVIEQTASTEFQLWRIPLKKSRWHDIDANLRKEGDVWRLDVFQSKRKDSDKAYLETAEIQNLPYGPDWNEVIAYMTEYEIQNSDTHFNKR